MKFSIFDINPDLKTVIVSFKNNDNKTGLKTFQATLKKNRLIVDIRLNNKHVNLSYWKIVAAFYGIIPASSVLTKTRGRNADCSVIFKDSDPSNCRVDNLIINYDNNTYNLSEYFLGEDLIEKETDVDIEF